MKKYIFFIFLYSIGCSLNSVSNEYIEFMRAIRDIDVLLNERKPKSALNFLLSMVKKRIKNQKKGNVSDSYELQDELEIIEQRIAKGVDCLSSEKKQDSYNILITGVFNLNLFDALSNTSDQIQRKNWIEFLNKNMVKYCGVALKRAKSKKSEDKNKSLNKFIIDYRKYCKMLNIVGMDEKVINLMNKRLLEAISPEEPGILLLDTKKSLQEQQEKAWRTTFYNRIEAIQYDASSY